jgi:hypothetical protein
MNIFRLDSIQIKRTIFRPICNYKSVAVSQSVYRLVTGWTTEGAELGSRQGQEFSLIPLVQTSSEAHPASYPIGTGDLSPGAKRSELETSHSP